ncbi:MAG: HNH endonuclease [Candidatus Binatia bacterium]
MVRLLSSALRQRVRTRAKGKCDYCLVHQDVSIFSHGVDHIVALRHGGQTVLTNLAFARLQCNRNKGADLT